MVDVAIIFSYGLALIIIMTPILIVIKYNKSEIKKLCKKKKKIITVSGEIDIPPNFFYNSDDEKNENNNDNEICSIVQ